MSLASFGLRLLALYFFILKFFILRFFSLSLLVLELLILRSLRLCPLLFRCSLLSAGFHLFGTRLGLLRFRRHHLNGRRGRRRRQRFDSHGRLHLRLAVVSVAAVIPIVLSALSPVLAALLLVLALASAAAISALSRALPLHLRILRVTHKNNCLLLFRRVT